MAPKQIGVKYNLRNEILKNKIKTNFERLLKTFPTNTN